MGQYHTRFLIKPGTRLRKEGFKWFLMENEFTKAELIANNYKEKNEKGIEYISGIIIDVYHSAESLDEAIERSQFITIFFTYVLSFITGVGLPRPNLQMSFESSPGSLHHEFIQFFKWPLVKQSRGEVNKDNLMSLMQKINEYQPPRRDKVTMAIRWYSHAVEENDIIDRLISYWFALECLNPALRDLLESEAPTKTCPQCGKEIPVQSNIDGVKAFMCKKVKNGQEIFRKAKKLRNDISHGTTTRLSQLVNPARKLTPLLAKIVIEAISFVIGFEPKYPINTKPLSLEAETKTFIRAILHQKQCGSLGLNSEIPRFEIEYKETGFYSDEHDRLIELPKLIFRKYMANDVRLSDIKVKLIGHKIQMRDAYFEVIDP